MTNSRLFEQFFAFGNEKEKPCGEGESQLPWSSRGAWLGLDGRWFSGSALVSALVHSWNENGV